MSRLGKIAVFLLPGSNCEQEMVEALKAVELEPYLYHYSSRKTISSFDGYVFVGGFSFEDRIRAGLVASYLPLVREVKKEAQKGKPVLGVCNGAQILVEAGFFDRGRKEIALGPNRMVCQRKKQHQGFYCNWVYVKKTRETSFTTHWSDHRIYPLPVAHAEGRFLLSPSFSWSKGALQYVTSHGKEAHYFPANPNGSVKALAGVCNEEGNVLAMMPHPERAAFFYQLPPLLKEAWIKAEEASLPGRAQHRQIGQPYDAGPGLSIFKSLKGAIH